MSRIIPIPTSRVGDFFVHQRLIDQAQSDQLAMFKLQNQISTGQRLEVPSDDAPAALRAINLQRLLDRKGQIRTNLQASNLYLGAADNNLQSVSDLISKLRADTVGVNGSLASADDRQTVVQEIDQTLQTLVDTANSKSQGRYLFAGSQSQTQPYTYNGQYVEYLGNEGTLRSYVDLERLFDTNVTGPQVFGGISDGVQGSADLNPQLTDDTLLSSINGGSGIGKNAAMSVSINTGTATVSSVVNLAGAVTVGDVARLIEAGAPAGTNIRADVTGSGLVLTTSSGTISVSEVGQGRTASELRILTPTGAPPSDTISGGDLNPAFLKTTALNTLLGAKAQGLISSSGANNDIVLTAGKNGADLNGVTVNIQAGGVAGSEDVSYDSNTKTLTVKVQQGISTASQVAARITAEGTFTASVDYHDAISKTQIGSGTIEVKNFGAISAGGSGTSLDTASGLIVTNGAKTVTLDTSSAQTVDDLLNLINGAGLGLLADVNADGTGINVRSRLSGADFTIGENGGNLATQLGIRTYTGDTKLADLNRSVGVPTNDDSTKDDLLITARDGTQLSIHLAGAKTVQDVIDAINNNTANNTGTTAVLARLAQTGNGIELVDSSTGGTGPLTVAAVEGSQAAKFLGFLPSGQTQTATTTPDTNGNYVLQSEDRHTLETDSVFNTLLRLKTALKSGDTEEIGRSLDRFDQDLSRVNFARSDIGARLQNLQVVDTRLQDENVQLRSALSQDTDVDVTQAISDMTARQFAYEASLRTSASLLQLSLLNFL